MRGNKGYGEVSRTVLNAREVWRGYTKGDWPVIRGAEFTPIAQGVPHEHCTAGEAIPSTGRSKLFSKVTM